MQPTACPDPQTLEQFLCGRAPPAEEERLLRHLEGCGCCAETVSLLLQSDTVVEALRDRRGPAGGAAGGGAGGLFERLRRLCPGRPGIPEPSADDTPRQPAWDLPAARPEESCDFLRPPEGPGEIGRLAGYRVLRVLGAGGMGVVFEAEDLRLQRRVALKVMRPALAASAAARQRFLREARSLAALRHDHIVAIYEADEDRGIPFLAMPLLAGESLEDRLRRQRCLPPAEVVRIGAEASRGLAAAHERGLVHRDIKPANIFLETLPAAPGSSAGAGRVQLLDFGLARAAEGEGHLTASGVLLGTPAYVAPEQARGTAVDARCDLFSLGAVLYRMCTGRQAFDGASAMAVIASLALDQPRPVRELNPEVPAPLADLVMRLLAKDPDARPASAAEVADALERIQGPIATPGGDEPPAQPPEPASPQPQVAGGPGRRSRALLAAAVLLLALVPLGYFFGGTVVRFATNQGEVVIEVDDPDTEVTLREGGAVIQDRKGQRRITLAAGRHELDVTIQDRAGEVHLFTRALELRRGGKAIINVHQELARARSPDAKPPVPAGMPPAAATRGGAEAERQSALWALSRGAQGVILVGAVQKDLASARDLPAGSFHVVNVRFQPGSPAADAELSRLEDLPELRSLKLQAKWVSDDSLSRLKALRGLRRLDLVARGVSDAGLLHLQGLTNLEYVILIETSVTDAGLVHLAALPNLHHLALGGMRMTEAGMKHLGALTNLSGWLTISNCGVTDAWLPHLQSLTRLSGLVLANNPVTGAGLASLKALPNLEEVNLRRTAVGDAGLVQLGALSKLQRLGLAETEVSDAGLVNLRGLSNLAHLDLSATRVSDAGLANLRHLAHLQTLSLEGTAVHGPGLSSLRGLAGLEELRLGSTTLTDHGANLVGDLKALQRLSLDRTMITDTGLEALKGLDRLQELDVTGTKVTAAGVAALQKALPKCRITGP
jgi:serine/threonine protein kinase